MLTLKVKEERQAPMQLNITTDYALRTVLYLGNKGVCRTAKEISEEMCIPRTYLIKVLTRLRRGGVVTSVSGHAGGYQLERKLSEISIGDILKLMERTIKINPCLEKADFCSRKNTGVCPIHKFYGAMQEEIETKWLSLSLQQILDTYREDEKG